jgi:hypothetical protein
MLPVLQSEARRVDYRQEQVCTHCKSVVGELHEERCSKICKRVSVDIVFRNSVIGQYNADVPVGWDDEMILFYYNECSWCADNILDDRTDVEMTNQETWRALEATSLEHGCICFQVEFASPKIIESTPYRRDRKIVKNAAASIR